jgi:peptide/nickel transport system substrate-binding protein
MYDDLDMRSWDIADSASGAANVLSFVYEQLVFGDWAKGLGGTRAETYMNYGVFNWSKNAKGGLAQSWEWTDPLTLVLHIRQGIRFQNKPPANGREVTAEDVAFCCNRFRNDPKSFFNSKEHIDSITATDKSTVTIKLKKPFAFMMEDFILNQPGYVYPPEIIKQYGKMTDWKLACGTGPFMVDSFVPDSIVQLKKNPDYWGYDELNPANKLPYADGVDVLCIKDMSSKLAALRTGKIDMLWGVSLEDGKSLQKTNPELLKAECLADKAPVGVWLRCDETPFKDLRVRQAMRMAIDFKSIANNYLGKAETLCFPIRPDASDYIPLNKYPKDIQELFSYNVTKAKSLLSQAGYPNGFSTELAVPEPQEAGVSILVSYWDAIGVKVKTRVVDTGTSRSLRQNLSYHGMIAFDQITGDSWRMLMRYQTGNSANYNLFSDKAYDQKMDNILAATSAAERSKKMQELSADCIRAASTINWPLPYVYQVWQPWIKGYHGEYHLGGTKYEGPIFARIWLDQNLKKTMGH